MAPPGSSEKAKSKLRLEIWDSTIFDFVQIDTRVEQKLPLVYGAPSVTSLPETPP